jgi:acyl-CoA synthetase (AMP-forming)/AMP-acid ligase II
VGYVGCLRKGIVPYMGDVQQSRSSLGSLLCSYSPAYIWCPEYRSNEFNCNSIAYAAFGFVLLKNAESQSFRIHDDLALLLTTSGSTGSAKLVRLSLRNLKSNSAAIASYLMLGSDERALTTLPMNYSYGLSIINSHLASGAALVMTSRTLMQREFWQLFKEQGVTSFGGVPYTYEMLEKLRFFRMDLPSLRTMTQAGGRLSPEMQQRFAEYAAERGVAFYVMYGQTEATARISYLPAAEAIRRIGSVGRAIPGGTLSLEEEDGRVMAGSGEIGELIYRGDNVMLGYAETCADLCKSDEHYGVLRTGDLAKCDADGYYYIVGRTKRFVKLFGHRINLDEVEAILRRAFPTVDCACGGRDDKLCVYISPPGDSSEVKEYLCSALGFHHSGFMFQTVERIPRSSAGKILYSQLDP